MSRYEDMYYGMDNSLGSEREVKKTGKSSTRKKSTEPTTENGVICNAGCVRVRKDPDPKAETLTIVDAQEKVEILEEINGYYKIRRQNGDVGYVLLKFCEKR